MIKKGKNIELFKAIADIMFAISCISLFFWVFGSTLHIISPSGSVWAVWGNGYRSIYCGLYLEVPGRILTSSFVRNVGIFCEAPAYAFFLGIAYSYELFFSNQLKRHRTIIYVITLISTGTSTALIILLYSIIASYWLRTGKATAKNVIVRAFLIGFSIIGYYYADKIIFSSSKMASVSLRQLDYINGINAWLASPIWGYGYMTDAEKFNSGFSNSISQLLIGGGLVLISIYIVSFVGIIFSGLKNDRRLTFWSTLIIILFGISIVGYAYISLTFVAMGYAFLIEKKSIRKERVLNATTV